MLTRLWCWLFGHKRWAKASTGLPSGSANPITGEPGHFYRWEKQPFCLRCEDPTKEMVNIDTTLGSDK